MVEYALIAALFALPLIGIMGVISGHAGVVLSTTGGNLTQMGANPPQ
jgi:Flp pilus assembly pilin Flp